MGQVLGVKVHNNNGPASWYYGTSNLSKQYGIYSLSITVPAGVTFSFPLDRVMEVHTESEIPSEIRNMMHYSWPQNATAA